MTTDPFRSLPGPKQLGSHFPRVWCLGWSLIVTIAVHLQLLTSVPRSRPETFLKV